MILRVPPEDRESAFDQFVADLKAAVRYAKQHGIDL
jgi:hypothetical protein